MICVTTWRTCIDRIDSTWSPMNPISPGWLWAGISLPATFLPRGGGGEELRIARTEQNEGLRFFVSFLQTGPRGLLDISFRSDAARYTSEDGF